jgi:arsenate reductase
MAATLYGIPNCDQVRKARAWLAERAVEFDFHDFKKAGINRVLVEQWLGCVAWEVLINKKGTSWRGLTDQQKAAVTDADSAVALMLDMPSVIKRPVLWVDGSAHIGFSDSFYQQIFRK